MLNRITHNWLLKLTALVLSIALWSHVRGQVNPWEMETFKARLQVQSPPGFILLNADEIPRTVVVTLRGPRLTLRSLKGSTPANPLTKEDAPLISSSQLRATLDFSNPQKGKQAVVVKAEVDVEDVEVLGTRPSEISVVLDASETKNFPIVAQVTAAGDMEVVGVKLNAERAKVAGPSKVLDSVKAVRTRMTVRPSEPGVVKVERAPLEAIDARGEVLEGLPIEPASVNLEVRVQEKADEKTVPVNVKPTGTPAGSYLVGDITVTPSQLTIRGPRSELKKIESLPATINVNGFNQNTTRRIEVDLPAGVEADNAEVRVHVEIIARTLNVPVATPTPAPTPTLPPPASQ